MPMKGEKMDEKNSFLIRRSIRSISDTTKGDTPSGTCLYCAPEDFQNTLPVSLVL